MSSVACHYSKLPPSLDFASKSTDTVDGTRCRRRLYMSVMSKQRPKKAGSKDRGPVLYLRLDDAHEAALQSFIAAQPVPPDRTAVGLKALEELLAKHGHWPPKKPMPAE